jgi:hypothetical protein
MEQLAVNATTDSEKRVRWHLELIPIVFRISAPTIPRLRLFATSFTVIPVIVAGLRSVAKTSSVTAIRLFLWIVSTPTNQWAGTFFTRARFDDLESTTGKVAAFQAGHGQFGLSVIRHIHEAETS